MKIEVLEIIKSLITCKNDHDEVTIATAILSLKDRWPNLTDDEKKEIEAAAYAIYYLDAEVLKDGTIDGVPFPNCLAYNDDSTKSK